MSTALQRALTDSADGVRPLPPAAAELLTALDAPPRLAAHLRAVHDVACRLTARIETLGLTFDRDAVLFGAATHDIGKTAHPDELEGPGQRHERAGYELLLNYGVPAELARFADTHSNPVTLEDLLVSVADTVWKGKRQTVKEQRLAEHLRAATGIEEWDAFLRLDAVLADLAADADRLLAFQFRHPVHP
jgi:putative nucleotidyltransferase with HDIG domain